MLRYGADSSPCACDSAVCGIKWAKNCQGQPDAHTDSPQQWLQDNTTASKSRRKLSLRFAWLWTFYNWADKTEVLLVVSSLSKLSRSKTGLVELPGFLTEKRMRYFIERNDFGTRQLQAVTSHSIRLPSTSSSDCAEKLSRPFARLMKMVEPPVRVEDINME